VGSSGHSSSLCRWVGRLENEDSRSLSITSTVIAVLFLCQFESFLMLKNLLNLRCVFDRPFVLDLF